jgi:hypothetical protein
MLTSVGLPRAEAVRQATAKLCACGAAGEACQVLIAAGEWDKALSLAPAVSLDYWRQLVAQRAHELAKSDVTAAVPLLAVAGERRAVEDALLRRDDFRLAMAAACVPPTAAPAPAPGSPTPAVVAPAREEISRVAWAWATHHLKAGHPLMAAAVLVGADDVPAAVEELARAGEPEVALAVARCAGLPDRPLLPLLALRAEAHGLWYRSVCVSPDLCDA